MPNINWVINSSDTYLSLLYERMHKCIYDSKVLHVDIRLYVVLSDNKQNPSFLPCLYVVHIKIYYNDNISHSTSPIIPAIAENVELKLPYIFSHLLKHNISTYASFIPFELILVISSEKHI